MVFVPGFDLSAEAGAGRGDAPEEPKFTVSISRCVNVKEATWPLPPCTTRRRCDPGESGGVSKNI
jgi:hypothetical protein